MGDDEIRAEIEQRKQRAKDLKIRELLWSLYYGRFSRYPELIEKNQAEVYPEVRTTFRMSALPSTQIYPKSLQVHFDLASRAYELLYREGPEEARDWPGDRLSRFSVTPASLMLKVNGEPVFEFNIRRSVQDAEDGPIFDNRMGEITRFIEGSWVQELNLLLGNIRNHEKGVWDKRRAPKLAEERKRFGV